VVSGDRALLSFYASASELVNDITTKIGFDDLEALNRAIQKLRGEIDQLEVRACAIAGEQNERAKEEMECSIPPLGS
jgi:hypothetical protein